MDEEFRQRGHLKLDMFMKAKEAPKTEVKSTLEKVVADMKEIKLEEPRKYEVPKVPSKNKFTYNTDFISRERNLANKGVKAFYNNNNFIYEKQVSVLIVGTSITNQSLVVKKVTDETKVTLKMLKCFTARRMDGKHKSDLNI